MTLAAVIVIAAQQYCKTLPWAIYFGSGSGNLAWLAFSPFPFLSILFHVHIPHPGLLLCASILMSLCFFHSPVHSRCFYPAFVCLFPYQVCTAPSHFLPIPTSLPIPSSGSRLFGWQTTFVMHLSADISSDVRNHYQLTPKRLFSFSFLCTFRSSINIICKTLKNQNIWQVWILIIVKGITNLPVQLQCFFFLSILSKVLPMKTKWDVETTWCTKSRKNILVITCATSNFLACS